MKNVVTAILLSLAGFGAQAQAQVTETRTTGSYNAIEAKNGIEVIITQSDVPSLKVETDKAANFANIITQQNGNTLKIYMKQPETETPGAFVPARVYVSQKSITGFKAEQGAIFKIIGNLQVAEASITLNSGAAFSGNIETSGKCTIKAKNGSGYRGVLTADALEANITGGAFAKLSGKAAQTTIFCSSANMQAAKFETDRADIKAQNASAVAIYAGSYIKVDTDTSSAITYYGEPTKTELGTNSYAVKRESHKFSLN